MKKLYTEMPKSIGRRREIYCTSCVEDVSIFVNEMSFTIIADCSGGPRETRAMLESMWSILYAVNHWQHKHEPIQSVCSRLLVRSITQRSNTQTQS